VDLDPPRTLLERAREKLGSGASSPVYGSWAFRLRPKLEVFMKGERKGRRKELGSPNVFFRRTHYPGRTSL